MLKMKKKQTMQLRIKASLISLLIVCLEARRLKLKKEINIILYKAPVLPNPSVYFEVEYDKADNGDDASDK